MNDQPEILSYIKERYYDEMRRFDHFENKCARFLTILSILIAVLGSIVGLNGNNVLEPTSAVQWAILLSLVLALFVMATAWGHSLLAIKIGDYPVVPQSRDNANYLVSASEKNAIRHIIDSYVGTTEQLQLVIREKEKNLELAYGELTLSGWFISAYLVLNVVKEILK